MRFSTLPAWLEWLEQQHPIAIDLGLERVQQVAQQMGLLQPSATVITVAGTNGKGSFVACAQALLLAHGKRVASYTSPHLLRFNERIQLNGSTVADADLLAAFTYVDAHLQNISLTYFEFTTLAALWIFSQASFDVIILEVGLGGRLDAVNIIEPNLAVITSIDLDHQEYLGNTRNSVAAEKCGILRKDTPLICAEYSPPEVLQVAINQRQSCVINRDFFIHDNATDWHLVAPQYVKDDLHLVKNGLAEPSQAAAICAVYQLLGDKADSLLIQQTQKQLTLAGRFQQFEYNGVTIILDVAHNAQAVDLLKKRLESRTLAQGRKRVIVFNMLQDKDIDTVLQALHTVFAAWFLGKLATPRALSCELISQKLSMLNQRNISSSDSIRQAFARAMSICQAGDEIVAMGSFYVVAEMLTKLEKL